MYHHLRNLIINETKNLLYHANEAIAIIKVRLGSVVYNIYESKVMSHILGVHQQMEAKFVTNFSKLVHSQFLQK